MESGDKKVREALFQLLFPFSLDADCHGRLRRTLAREGFVPFRLDALELEDAFYGPRHRVSHRAMERYYLPFTNHVLFPGDDNPESFQRMSKALGLRATLHTARFDAPFELHSVDVVLCPFDTGFITLRIELSDVREPSGGAEEEDGGNGERDRGVRATDGDGGAAGGKSGHGRGEADGRDGDLGRQGGFGAGERSGILFSQAIEFADRLRVMQDEDAGDRRAWVEFEGKRYEEIQDFIFQAILPHTVEYLDRTPMDGSYFEKLPYLIDERMFVMAHYAFDGDEEIALLDRYRAVRLDGLDASGEPRISATHEPYIRRFCRDVGFDRWAPDTYYLADESCFCCLTRRPEPEANALADKMLGEYYYGLLLNLFHRIVLLKLANAYSRVQLERTPEQTEVLIRAITTFSAKYDFLEVVSQTQGREIFLLLRRMYGNDELFEDVKMTLTDLYKYQENATSKRSGYLLTVLTIYTVISGIYGMNQVIEDLKGPIRWSAAKTYSPFEWIALAVTLSGLVVAFALTANVLSKWGADWLRRFWRRR